MRYGCFVDSYPGGAIHGWFGWSDPPRNQPAPPWEFELSHQAAHFPDPHPSFGFSAGRETYLGRAFNIRYWEMPAWSLVSAFAVLPTIATFRQVRAVRRR